MTVPVLFLDIDGVLNCRDYFKKLHTANPKGPLHGIHSLCRERIQLLNEVVSLTGCTVTVSSTWRRDRNCRNLLRRAGFRGTFSEDWRTDWLQAFEQPDIVRGDEIDDWLRRNPTELYAIVDDDSDMLPHQMGRFVQTSNEYGLRREHADRLMALMTWEGRVAS